MRELYDDVKQQKTREQIIKRSKMVCQGCGCGGGTLHVHHNKYNYKAEIWDCLEEDLLILCENCHWHRKNDNDFESGGAESCIWWVLSESKEHVCLAVEGCPHCDSESFHDSGLDVTCENCGYVLPLPSASCPRLIYYDNISITSSANRLLGVTINVHEGKMVDPPPCK